MATKENLLKLLEENRGIYFSGEDIGSALSVSRTSVWKAVKALQSKGYDICATTNKGYCLAKNTDIISNQGIQKYLSETNKSQLELTVLQSVTSTNSFFKEKAINGAKEGRVIIAGEQTAGRGRAGKSFFSPKDTGIYMSLLLRPTEEEKNKVSKVTTIAALAMSEAIEKVSNKKAAIKWVNDIFVNHKKVCGILTEISLDLESRNIEYIILGLGVNVYEPQNGFPKEIKDIAGAIFKKSKADSKNRLIAGFLERFFKYYKSENIDSYVEKYRKKCFVIGKEIFVIKGKEKLQAFVRNLDNNCHLQVTYLDGKQEILSSGEISLKLNKI